MPDTTGQYDSAPVRASVLHPGDTILVHSGRRRQVRAARILRCHGDDAVVKFDTTIGRITVPATAQVDAVLGKVARSR